MDEVQWAKAMITAFFALLTSVFGTLAIPIFLMVTSNVMDYATGLMASKHRKQSINSYQSIHGIKKKIMMWILVIVGAIVDTLVKYASDVIGWSMPLTFPVACVVTLWIVCSELISILENIQDAGVAIPTFLLPLMKKIKTQVEKKIADEKEE